MKLQESYLPAELLYTHPASVYVEVVIVPALNRTTCGPADEGALKVAEYVSVAGNQ